MSPAWKLLLACAAAKTDLATAVDEAVAAGLEWGEFLTLAGQQGLAGPAGAWLEPAAHRIPPPWRERLRHQQAAHARRNLAVFREMLRLLFALDRWGVHAVPFKGPLLAQMAYGDLSARQFGDLDLWVSREDFTRAADALRELGYRTSGKVYGSEVQFGRPDGWVVVDLHWSLTVPKLAMLLDEERMRQDLYRLQAASQPLATLAPGDMLAVLCVHGLKEGWPKLKTVRDVAALIRHPALHWEDLLVRWQKQGSLRTVLLGLALAHTLLNAPLPDAIQEAMDQDAGVQTLCGVAIRRLRGESRPSASPVWSAWRMARFHLAALTLPVHRLIYMQRLLGEVLVPNERDRAVLPLPRRLAWARRPLRSLRLVWEYGPGALHGTRSR